MKIIPPLALAGILALAGCAPRYTMTLNSGNTITTYGKPRLNPAGDAMLYKDAQGRWHSIPAGKVSGYAPR